VHSFSDDSMNLSSKLIGKKEGTLKLEITFKEEFEPCTSFVIHLETRVKFSPISKIFRYVNSSFSPPKEASAN
jgi:hypothetical protein